MRCASRTHSRLYKYPVAGRFLVSDDGELNVACTGDGVWFVEEELVPCPPPQVKQEDVLLMLQACSGCAIFHLYKQKYIETTSIRRTKSKSRTMSFFSATKLAPTLVAPCEPTPSGNLPLSFMDRLPASRFMVDSIQVFGHGQQPAMVIKAALSKALVTYYPVAGRLAMSDQGELEVACTRDGVWFVEASVDGSLEDLNHLELPLAVPKEELLPYLSPEAEKDLIVMMQVCFLFKHLHGITNFFSR